MDVNSASGISQMQQMQMRNIYGESQGFGQMKDIMQSLSQEDRTAVRDQMQALSKDEKKTFMDDMKNMEVSESSSADTLQSIMDLLSSSSNDNTQKKEDNRYISEDSLLDIYA
ncbi:MAG: hypothetical protein GQ570_12895 [Helicobacteraceae bacterium]|nr:hypothetical protein [Helicobacteraceae bacterium]